MKCAKHHQKQQQQELQTKQQKGQQMFKHCKRK